MRTKVSHPLPYPTRGVFALLLMKLCRVCEPSPLGVCSLLALEQFAGTELLPQGLYLLWGQLIPEFLAL